MSISVSVVHNHELLNGIDWGVVLLLLIFLLLFIFLLILFLLLLVFLFVFLLFFFVLLLLFFFLIFFLLLVAIISIWGFTTTADAAQFLWLEGVELVHLTPGWGAFVSGAVVAIGVNKALIEVLAFSFFTTVTIFFSITILFVTIAIITFTFATTADAAENFRIESGFVEQIGRAHV